MGKIPCLCSICFCVYDLTEFRFMQCGHGICVECTKGFQAPRCSSCRAERGTHVPHAVYIDQAEDTPAAEAERLTNDLTNLHEDPSTENFKNLANRIRDPQHQSGLSAEDKERLLEAAKMLEKQIFPQMRKKEEHKANAQKLQAENDYLAKEVDSLQRQLKDLQFDRSRMQRLEREKTVWMQKYEEERRMKADWESEYRALQESSAREQRAMREEWAEERAILQSELEEETKKTKLAVNKAKALGRENTRLKRQKQLGARQKTSEREAGDESLVIA